MSGGYFQHNCFRIAAFAYELENELDQNDDLTLDIYGDQRGQGFDNKTVDNLKAALIILKLAAKLAREVEYLYSGDLGPETFNKRVNEIVDKASEDADR